MSLAGKNALVYGGGGAVGGAIARAFALKRGTGRVGRRPHHRLAARGRGLGRHRWPGAGTATTAVVDAFDEAAVDAHAEVVATELGPHRHRRR